MKIFDLKKTHESVSFINSPITAFAFLVSSDELNYISRCTVLSFYGCFSSDDTECIYAVFGIIRPYYYCVKLA